MVNQLLDIHQVHQAWKLDSSFDTRIQLILMKQMTNVYVQYQAYESDRQHRDQQIMIYFYGFYFVGPLSFYFNNHKELIYQRKKKKFSFLFSARVTTSILFVLYTYSWYALSNKTNWIFIRTRVEYSQSICLLIYLIFVIFRINDNWNIFICIE